MTKPRSSSSKRFDWAWYSLAPIVVLTLVCGFLGWLREAPAFGHVHGWKISENAIFLALRAFIFDSIYTDDSKVKGDVLLIIARWGGMVVAASGILLTFITITRSEFTRFTLRRHRGHTLVVGDHPLVEAILRAAKHGKERIVHVSDSASDPSRSEQITTVPRVDWEDALTTGRARHARRVIVAETDVGQSADTVLRTIDWLKKEQVKDCWIAVHFDDPAAAEGFHHVGAGYVYTFCQAQASARAVLEARPPFHLARLCGASRIHILVVGFSNLAEAIVCDAMINNVTRDFDNPWFTIIDDDPDAAEAAFRDRHSEMASASEACEVRFLAMPIGRAIDHLISRRQKDEPEICAVYVCHDQSTRAFTDAVSLREHAQKAKAFTAPIFVNMRSDACFDENERPLRLIGCGGVDEAVRVSGVLDEKPDEAAKSVHAAYSSIYNHVYEYAEKPPDPWELLSEELRISNRRVITHIPAKLDSLGFDLDPWLALPPRERPNPPILHPTEVLLRGEDDRHMAAELEHRRWMADRWVNGWRYGTPRDSARKFHPDLVPFEKLPDKVKNFDYEVVDWLKDFVKPGEGGLRRKPRPRHGGGA